MKTLKRKTSRRRDSVRVKGFYRLNIVDRDGSVVGDSGWKRNLVTDLGFKLYLADNIGKSSGSKQVGFVALGTGGAPAAGDTKLAGEISHATSNNSRPALTYANVSSKTARFTATFASSDSFFTGAVASNISNIGLYAATTSNDTLFAGNTYASSSLASNQNVNISYELRFS